MFNLLRAVCGNLLHMLKVKIKWVIIDMINVLLCNSFWTKLIHRMNLCVLSVSWIIIILWGSWRLNLFLIVSVWAGQSFTLVFVLLDRWNVLQCDDFSKFCPFIYFITFFYNLHEVFTFKNYCYAAVELIYNLFIFNEK